MKGLGNYRFRSQVERRLGTLVQYRGPTAVVRFHNGATYSLPSKPLRKVGIEAGKRFVLLVTRRGGSVSDIRVEPPPRARPPTAPRPMPKVMVKSGRKLVTRRRSS